MIRTFPAPRQFPCPVQVFIARHFLVLSAHVSFPHRVITEGTCPRFELLSPSARCTPRSPKNGCRRFPPRASSASRTLCNMCSSATHNFAQSERDPVPLLRCMDRRSFCDLLSAGTCLQLSGIVNAFLRPERSGTHAHIVVRGIIVVECAARIDISCIIVGIRRAQPPIGGMPYSTRSLTGQKPHL